MQVSNLGNVYAPVKAFKAIMALAWSPNGQRLAAATSDGHVHLFNEKGERKDKFGVKPGDSKSGSSFLVTALAYSPDSGRLAVGQTDNYVIVYKIGTKWGDRKSISNRFKVDSTVVDVFWPRQTSMLISCADGKVFSVNWKTQKMDMVHEHPSPCVGMSPLIAQGNQAGIPSFAVSHYDGSVYVVHPSTEKK
ncbi:hypothetical protein KIPB_012956, partial [Kipferlia bialata]|eukprot:g12956.t1